MTTSAASLAWFSQGLDDVAHTDAWLAPLEADWIGRMRFEKRRSEFTLGRWTAKNAIARYLGRPLDPTGLRDVVIDRASDGAPAPQVEGRRATVSISMTDRADQAVCVVGPAGLDLGVDLELVERRSEAFVADYLTASEQRLVEEGSSRGSRDLRANLVWSAKESALKVLRTGLRRDTRTVEVTLEEETGDWSGLQVRTAEGEVFPGWWRRYGDFLLTVASRQPCSAPKALVEPPGLATARPAHRWMETSSRSRND